MRGRSVAGLIVLAIALLAVGSAQGWGLLHSLGYALLLTILLAYAWTWSSVRGIYARQRPRMLRAQVGETLEERSELENLSWLPKPWLEVLDASDYPDHNLSQVLSLGPLGRRVRTLRTRCRQRGQFVLGPVWIAGGDPFGLFRRERRISDPVTLVVFPRTVHLASFGRLPGELPGGSLQGERVHFVTPNVATVRDYQPGDGFNRVHWPSSARLNKLVAKDFERDPSSDVWLVLDLDRLTQAGSGAESTEEYGVTCAASLSRYLLEHDRALGLISQGEKLPLDRGPRQLTRVLELLAVVRPCREPALLELLVTEAQRFQRGDSIIVVTPTSDRGWVRFCRDLVPRGVRTSVVLLDASTFGPAPPCAALLGNLVAMGLPTYLVRAAADLSKCLARPSPASI